MSRWALTRRSVLAGAAWSLLGCRGEPPAEGGFAGASPGRGHLLREPPAAAVPAVTHRTQVVIAGGGVAGLAAARALHQRGIEDFALLEMEDEAGGNSRAGRLAGLPCPLGAHYLPVPGDSAPEVQDLLEELGLRRRVAGRWTYEERHLCHSPQERLFFQGQWQDGLLPVQGVGAATMAQYRRFAQAVDEASRAAPFPLPSTRALPPAPHLELDAMGFAAWLDRAGLDDPHLRWYLDYCCRDDYGAGTGTVSAWAGIHYFASRHGFHAPGDESAGRDAVLTWPEGNGWLTRRLTQPLGDRLRPAHVVLRVRQVRDGVEVDALNLASRALVRWQARHCIVALPLFVAARVVESVPAPLQRLAAQTRYAPWIVVNLHLREPLRDRGGAAPAWDNLVYGSTGLGYVDARHQSLNPAPGETVLTWYHAPGEAARRAVLDQPWTHWRDLALADLAVPHPDLAGKLGRVEVARYGHAMAIPLPGRRALATAGSPQAGRLSFAHGDWAGYSVFEEAFSLGHWAGRRAG